VCVCVCVCVCVYNAKNTIYIYVFCTGERKIFQRHFTKTYRTALQIKQLHEIHLNCLLPDSTLKFLNKEDFKTDSHGTQLEFSKHFYIKINNNLKFNSKYLNGRLP